MIGAAIVLPFAMIEIFYYGFPKIETWKIGFSVVYLVIGATILTYWFWNKAVRDGLSINKWTVLKWIAVNKYHYFNYPIK